jgi:FAD synthetase
MAEVLALREVALSCDKKFCKKLDKALKIIESALHVYSEAELAFSFNGGKDSTVVLHLLRAAFAKSDASGSPRKLSSMQHVYFETNHEFSGIVSFIEQCDSQ